MKPFYRLILFACFIAFSGVSTAQINTDDPFSGHYQLGNSAEIITISTPAAYDSCFTRVYDFIGSSNTVVPKPVHSYPTNGLPLWDDIHRGLIDIATADIDDDNDLDVVLVKEGDPEIYVPKIDTASLDWLSAGDGGMVGYGFHAPYRIVKANLIDNGRDEVIMATTSNCCPAYLRLGAWYCSDVSSLSMSEIFDCIDKIELMHVYFSYPWFDVAACDFDGDGLDEALVIGSEIPIYWAYRNWSLTAQIYKFDLDYEEFYPHYYCEGWWDRLEKLANIDSCTMNSMEPECRFIEQMAVTVGDFDGNVKKEAVIGYQDFTREWVANGEQWDYTIHTTSFL
nr:hypothetical protein [candidate division Zixibacteria bacterium]